MDKDKEKPIRLTAAGADTNMPMHGQPVKGMGQPVSGRPAEAPTTHISHARVLLEQESEALIIERERLTNQRNRQANDLERTERDLCANQRGIDDIAIALNKLAW